MSYRFEERTYPVQAWQQPTWEDRVKTFLKTDDTPSRFNWPFPMGVFGTLRQSQGNNPLMHGLNRGWGEEVREAPKSPIVSKHRLAFLPHFFARGLGIYYKKNSCAPFEVFYYEPENWVKMIYRVDCLESFDPQSDHGADNGGYYFRTLVWLRLLPEGYEDKWFPKDGLANISEHRDLAINPERWNSYERVAAWVYSNMNSTIQAAGEPNTPIIWPTNGKTSSR